MAGLQTAKPGVTRVGWVGTGVMGAAMCGQLVRGGFSATVYNRTAAKAQGLVDAVRGAAQRAGPPAPPLGPRPIFPPSSALDRSGRPPFRARCRPRPGSGALSPGLRHGGGGRGPPARARCWVRSLPSQSV